MHSAQRQATHRFHAAVAQETGQRESIVFVQIIDYKRLLGLPNLTVDGPSMELRSDLEGAMPLTSFHDIGPHHIFLIVVQHDSPGRERQRDFADGKLNRGVVLINRDERRWL
jgi:hypothetical protein